jgi:hypothetical protein
MAQARCTIQVVLSLNHQFANLAGRERCKSRGKVGAILGDAEHCLVSLGVLKVYQIFF